MNYEQKYNELIKSIKKLRDLNPSDKGICNWVNNNVPELAESEDEKIRKEIVRFIQMEVEDEIVGNKWIAWLEKQQSVEEIVARCKDSWYNEGKIAGMAEGLSDDEKYQQGWHDALEAIKEKADNANKVESKFKACDWVILTAGELSTTLQIVSVDTNKKLYWFNDNSYLPIVDEECLHLWTIQDAKNGDVLSSNVLLSKYNKPFIYNGNHNSTHVGAYCGISTENRFNVATEKCRWTANVNIRPATKDQRDTLLKAMADAGYEWDAEKKELKKIESNPAWSEEDDYNLQCMIAKVTSDIQKGNIGRNNELMDWLKSLKGRYTWKPSEEQMNALEHFVRSIGESGFVSPYDANLKLVYSLLNDLKKLKEL